MMVGDRGETGKIFTANICSSWQLIFGLIKPQSLFLEFSYMILNPESGVHWMQRVKQCQVGDFWLKSQG